jgi:phage repressor protein C with HTH and peptisase S24 domain
MEPDYPDGAIAWVAPTIDLREGEVGLFIHNGEGYIKKLGKGELVSINTSYPPILLDQYSRTDIIGKVVAHTRDPRVE